MTLPVKYSFVLIVKISDRRPYAETADIACERAIRIQNTGVHGDVVHQNSTSIRVRDNSLTACQCICAVDPGSKPVKVVCSAYLQGVSTCSGMGKYV